MTVDAGRPQLRYEDALDRVWIETARRIGLRVIRTGDAYATTDGRGTMAIGAPATLDPDDSLAQMIFHELCHSLVQGPDSFERPDWGLDNESARDHAAEQACQRVQAVLAAPFGLRRFFAPTTDYRAFYDALAPDPLTPEMESTVIAARRAAHRAEQAPWAPHLERALRATSEIASLAARFAGAASIYSRVDPIAPRHPSGFPFAARGGRAPEGATCGGCAWLRATPGGRARCAAAPRSRVKAISPACERFEAALDCRTCGACCREAFHAVELAKREPFLERHPKLVVVTGHGPAVARIGDRCAALAGDGAVDPFTCTVYEDRPRTCRDFTEGSDHCLDARRRVGLSR